MSLDTHSWQRFAKAVRQLDAGTAEAANSVQPNASIPWLPALPGQVHALWLRLIWKRWVLVAISISLAVLAGFFLASRPAAPAARVPRISVPAAP